MIILIMGVTGSGKTTIGEALARELNCAFTDTDSLHSPANRVKMAAGVALSESDREAWLAVINKAIDDARAKHENHVFACSALRQIYRDRLDPDHKCRLVYLRGGANVLADRLKTRTGQLVSRTALNTQLQSLEEPNEAIYLDIREPPEKLVAMLAAHFKK